MLVITYRLLGYGFGIPFINKMKRGQDSNLRPLGYEPNELPSALPRLDLSFIHFSVFSLT
jgi:hypothetical protein